MKKGTKILAAFVLGLFIISMFAGMVSAESLFQKIFGSTSNWNVFQLSEGFRNALSQSQETSAQFLFFILVFLIILAVSSYLPFIPQGKYWLNVFISIIVSILAVYYLQPKEILTMLASYQALGVVLTSILPFFVIFAVSKKLIENNMRFGSKVLWIMFFVYLFVRVGSMDIVSVGYMPLLLYGLTAIAVLIMIIFENWIYFKIFKEILKGEVSTANDRYIAHLTVKMEKILDEMDSASPKAKVALEKEYDELQQKLNQAQSK